MTTVLRLYILFVRPFFLPIMQLLIIVCTCFMTSVQSHTKTYTIIINPAGNTQSTERLIDNTFERSITLHAAEALKKQLEKLLPPLTVLLTRAPGHVTTPLQNAHFANSLSVDLFVSLHFYQETDTKPHLYIYQFSYSNALTVKPSDFTFYRYDQSYFFNRTSSAKAAILLEKAWAEKPHAQQFTTHNAIEFPCSSLIGITSPAIALDIGIKNPTDWRMYIQPLMEGIYAILEIHP